MNQISVIATGLRFPEGPAFASDGTMWCVEQEGESLFYLRPDGSTGRVHVGEGSVPNGLYIDSRDRLWFCDSGLNAIRCLNYSSDATLERQPETIIDRVDGEPLNRPNDLIIDPSGNLIFTCPGPSDDDGHGYVCACTPVGEVRKIAEGLVYPNGLYLLPDRYTLLIAETHRKRIWYGYWNGTADELEWEHPDVWASTGPDGHGPDGMTIGPDGNLYVALFGAGRVQVYNPQGQLQHTIELPGQKPTNIACDPTGHRGLVVTEAERGQLLQLSV